MSNWPKSICQRNRERSLQCALKQVLKMVARNFSCRNLFFSNPLSTENFLKLQAKLLQRIYLISLTIENFRVLSSKLRKKSIFNTSSPNGQGKLSHLSCFEISYNLPGMSSMSWCCHQTSFWLSFLETDPKTWGPKPKTNIKMSGEKTLVCGAACHYNTI